LIGLGRGWFADGTAPRVLRVIRAADVMVAGMNAEALAKVTAPVPLGRLGEPTEIAQTVGFIFENDFFTGRCLEIDGGLRL
jgi:NAD(P)-dependent dehydrogenase (short-subunit alcohol dehydrogenase family)